MKIVKYINDYRVDDDILINNFFQIENKNKKS